MTIIPYFTRFLLWSQKYTHIDMLYFTKGGFYLSLGNVVSMACSLVSGLVLANVLTKEVYGQYSYILTISSLFAITTLPGINTAVTQSVAAGFGGTIFKAFKTRVRWGLVGSFICFIISAFYSLILHNGSLAITFALVGIITPLVPPMGIYGAVLDGKKRFDLSTLYFAVSQTVTTLAIVLLAITLKNPYVIFLGYALTSLPFDIFFLQRTLKLATNNKEDPGVIVYGKHLTLISVSSTIVSYLDRLLIFNLLGPAQLAIYAIAITPPEYIKSFFSITQPLSLPKYAEQDNRAIRSRMLENALKLFAVSVVTIGIYIGMAPFLYHWLFPKYTESIFYSQIFALSLLNFALTPAGIFLQAKRKIKEQYISGVFSSIFQVVSMVGLVLVWGLLGLIVARILTRILASLVNVVLYFRVPLDNKEDAKIHIVSG